MILLTNICTCLSSIPFGLTYFYLSYFCFLILSLFDESWRFGVFFLINFVILFSRIKLICQSNEDRYELFRTRRKMPFQFSKIIHNHTIKTLPTAICGYEPWTMAYWILSVKNRPSTILWMIAIFFGKTTFWLCDLTFDLSFKQNAKCMFHIKDDLL